jgi:IS30 family transposase
VNSTTKCNFDQCLVTKDILVSKASGPPSQSHHDFQHLTQIERYQIYILMKDEKTQIAKLMDRHWSTISRELVRNTGLKGCCPPNQACPLAEERSLGSRNAVQNQVGISHETIYRHVYVDKVAGGSLYQQLRCQKKRKKRAIKSVEVKLWIEGRSVSPQST